MDISELRVGMRLWVPSRPFEQSIRIVTAIKNEYVYVCYEGDTEHTHSTIWPGCGILAPDAVFVCEEYTDDLQLRGCGGIDGYF